MTSATSDEIVMLVILNEAALGYGVEAKDYLSLIRSNSKSYLQYC